MKVSNLFFPLIFLFFCISNISCSSGPADADIVLAIKDNLLYDQKDLNIKEINILEKGNAIDGEDYTYWAVRANVKGTFKGLFGNTESIDKIYNFRIHKDDYNKWKALRLLY